MGQGWQSSTIPFSGHVLLTVATLSPWEGPKNDPLINDWSYSSNRIICLKHRWFIWIPKWEKHVSSKRRFPLLACWLRNSENMVNILESHQPFYISSHVINDIQIPDKVGLNMAIFKTKKCTNWKSIHSEFRVFLWVLASMIYAYLCNICSRFLPMQPGARPASWWIAFKKLPCHVGDELMSLMKNFQDWKSRISWRYEIPVEWISWNIGIDFAPIFNGEVVARLQAYLLHVRRLKFKFEMVPPPKTNMTMNNPPFEDVFPIENADVPLSC